MSANAGLKTSRKAQAEIKDWEKDGRTGRVALEAFDDGYGNWTIGWGRVNHPAGGKVRPGETIDLETAETYFQEDLGIAERAVRAAIKVPLTQGQFDALVIFTFNAGGGALAKSTFAKLINRGRTADVPAAWMLYAYATDQKTKQKVLSNGLVRRRRAELGFWRDLAEPDREDDIVLAPGTLTNTRPGAVLEAVQKSWTVWGALMSLFGGVLQTADTAIAFAVDAAAEATRLAPVKSLALSLGQNLDAIGAAVTVAGVLMVISRRLNAAAQGKIG
ncbi:MAG: lysozyme [Hyphomicrobium sp.]